MVFRLFTGTFILFMAIGGFAFSQSSGKPEFIPSEEFVLIGNATGFSGANWKQVKSIFQGERSFWSNGSSVILVLPANNLPVANQIAKGVYGTNVAGMQKFWLALVFQGRGKPPILISSEEEIIRFVSQNPGAVALISATAKNRATEWLIPITEK